MNKFNKRNKTINKVMIKYIQNIRVTHNHLKYRKAMKSYNK